MTNPEEAQRYVTAYKVVKEIGRGRYPYEQVLNEIANKVATILSKEDAKKILNEKNETNLLPSRQ